VRSRDLNKLLIGVVILVGALFTQVGSAAAWSASPSGHFVCVVDSNTFLIGLDWTVTSWRTDGPSGENPQIIVDMSRDGGPAEQISTGSFTPDNGYQFSGSIIVPDATTTITLSAYAASRWGDGTVDVGVTAVELAVPTLDDIGDPRCLVAPEPTEEAAPTPTTQPAATPTPEVKAEVEQATPTEVPSTPQPTATVAPQATPTPEVLGQQLARTGADTGDLAVFGLVLVAVGFAIYYASRFAPYRG
jgi:hypothetical protein